MLSRSDASSSYEPDIVIPMIAVQTLSETCRMPEMTET